MQKWMLLFLCFSLILCGCRGKQSAELETVLTSEEIADFRETHEQIQKTYALIDMEKRPVEYYLQTGCDYVLLEFVEELTSEKNYLEPGNEGEQALAQKAGIPAYHVEKRNFCFRYMKTVIEGKRENRPKERFYDPEWQLEDFIQNDTMITYVSSMWNVPEFVAGEKYLFLVVPFLEEDKLELVTSYSYYVTEEDHVVAATYEPDNASEKYTGYSLKSFEKNVKEKMNDKTSSVSIKEGISLTITNIEETEEGYWIEY